MRRKSLIAVPHERATAISGNDIGHRGLMALPET
jgi:hypothetical protein